MSFMSFSKSWCFVLLCAAMLATACVRESEPPAASTETTQSDASAADATAPAADAPAPAGDAAAPAGDAAAPAADAAAPATEGTAPAADAPDTVTDAPATGTDTTATASDKTSPATDAPKKGDEITFGSYPQSGSDKEPLTWIVLDVDNTKHAMLLLSKYIIDSKPYHTKNVAITWENCTLRAWLNDEFMSTAFTKSEIDKILTTHLANPNNEFSKTAGGNDTDDKVFLLSLADIWHADSKVPNSGKYFTSNAKSSNEERKVYATAYAHIGERVKIQSKPNTIAHPITPDNPLLESSYYKYKPCKNLKCSADWWLRSPGTCKSCAASITTQGRFNDYDALRVNSTHIGVRPALWIQY